MAENKTQPTDEPVADFIARIADPQRRADCETVLAMMRRAAGVEPVMWGSSIVGFGHYQYRYASGRTGDWPLIGFSPRKNDLTVYLMPDLGSQEALLAKLGKHKTGVSCLYLKRLSDVDLPTLEALVQGALQRMAAQRLS
jgi:hypothetical protein